MLLEKSLQRLFERSFAARFYEALLSADARVPKLFERTSFDRQFDLLAHGLLMILAWRRGEAIGKLALQRLGHVHGPGGANVPRDLFQCWKGCFLDVASRLDPQWSEELAFAWSDVLDRATQEIVAHMEGADG